MPHPKLLFSSGRAESEIRAFFESDGYLGPATAFTRIDLERIGFITTVKSLVGARGWARNRHLDVPLIANVCRNEQVISGVRAVLGPNLMLWRSNIFAIGDHGLPWHQDEYRTLLKLPVGAKHCSVQISFTDSTRINTVTLVPKMHRWTDDELRQRGFAMRAGSGDGLYGTPQWTVPIGTQTLDMPLRAGQFYVFHPKLLHASCLRRWPSPNAAEQPWLSRLKDRILTQTEELLHKRRIRYSIALRIATPDTEILPAAYAESPARATPVLLAGTDSFGINRLGQWAS